MRSLAPWSMAELGRNGVLPMAGFNVVCQLWFLLTLCVAAGAAGTPKNQATARSFIKADYPPRAVHLAVDRRDEVISMLQSQSKEADNRERQAISFVLAEWGVDYDKNKDFLTRSLQLCEMRARSCDEDTAGYLIGLYSDGHTDVLPVLVSVGPKTDAAVAERLGAFYGDVLAESPKRFFAAVRSLDKGRRSASCEMAGTGDGGGISEDALKRAKAYVISAGDETARSCLEVIDAANKKAQSQNRP